MEDRLIHSMSLNLVNRLNRYANREGNDLLRLIYGMEVLIMNVSKIIILFIVALLMNTLVPTLTALVGFNFTRRAAYGAHAKNSTSCTVSSIALFILVPYFLKGFVINNLVVFPVFCAVILALFLYAPADTESKPLVGRKKRARLKKRALLFGAMLMLGTLLIENGGIKTMLTLGAIYEAVSILPVTYSVLNKKYRNYEQYENQTIGNTGAV